MSLNYFSIQRYLYCSHVLYHVQCCSEYQCIYTKLAFLRNRDMHIKIITYCQIPIQHVRTNIQYLKSFQHCKGVHFTLYLCKQFILIDFLFANLMAYTCTYVLYIFHIYFICIIYLHSSVHIFISISIYIYVWYI